MVLNKMILCLDAGHGPEPGAVGNNLQEATLTGDICERVATMLSSYDVDVRLAPRTDSLNERADYANGIGAAAYVSIHINASSGTAGTGFESYIYPTVEASSVLLQNAVHDSVKAYLFGLSIADRGKKTADFAVLRLTNMPAVLLECLFINNPLDAAWLKNNSFLDGLANAIAWGLAQAYKLNLRASDGTVEAIRALQAKGIMLSPEYWLTNAKAGKQCDGLYVAGLIRNFAEKIGG